LSRKDALLKGEWRTEMDAQAMKIIVLLMLIGVIVAMSHLPIRRQAKAPAPATPDSVPANA
jgi:hypothetical protein